MTPQQANTLISQTLAMARDWTGHPDNIAVIDCAIAAIPYLAPAPTEPAVDRTKLRPMQNDDDLLAGIVRQWYFDCDGHYIDVALDDGKYSIFFKDRARKGEAWLDQADEVATPASPASRDHLLKIIAFAYQIAGWHDAPEHILAVLAHPESATAAQVDSMLPYQVGTSSAAPGKPRFKDHDIRQLVNDLRAIAIEFHAAGQLRERISGAVQQFLAAPQVAQASQPTSAEAETAWAAYCPAGFQFIHADQRVVEDFVYTRRYCGEGPYSIMHMKVSRPTSAEGKDSERLEGGAALYAALSALVDSLTQSDEEGLIEHAPEMVNARKALAGGAPSPAWDAALEAAAELFPQPHMEYFGDAIQLAIRSLKSSPVPDPCPQCERGGVCKSITCGRLRSSELMAMYGTAPQAPT